MYVYFRIKDGPFFVCDNFMVYVVTFSPNLNKQTKQT